MSWLVPAARAADFTYQGNGQSVGQGFEGAWSAPSNWAGGIAPSGSVGKLLFPATPGCSGRRNEACLTTDDVSGLNANALELEADYLVGAVEGDPLTLGSGGLTMHDSHSDSGRVYFAPTIQLDAPQTWSIFGNHPGAVLQIASVTGAGEPLTIDFSNGCTGRLRAACTPRLHIADGVEVGAITATGPGLIGLTGGRFSLNGTDGNPVGISGGASLAIAGGASTAPLNFSHGFLQLNTASRGLPSGPLSVTGDGGVSLDSKSGVTFVINSAGRSPGKDYAQLRAHGPVSIGNAFLKLSGPDSGPYCAHLRRGRVDTLVTTTGPLSGTFRATKPIDRGEGLRFVPYSVRDGKTVPVYCADAAPDWSFTHAPRVRINYTAHSVTATVVRPLSNSG